MNLPFNDGRDPEKHLHVFPKGKKSPSFSVGGEKHLLIPPVLTPTARSPPLSKGLLLSTGRGKLRHGGRMGPTVGTGCSPCHHLPPQPGLARVRGIYKADKGAERIFQTPKLRNLSSPSTDIVCNYRLGVWGGDPSMAGLGGHTLLPVSPQRASPSSPSPQQVPRVRHQPVPPLWPRGTPIPEGPWWHRGPPPCPV